MVFASHTEAKWYLLIDEFGGKGYARSSLLLSAPGSGRCPGHEVPAGARHGTVLPVTRQEHERLLGAGAVG